MKKVITNEELYKKMEEALTLLCGVVKTTLGPKGNNVIINNSYKMPYITNDGVTIALNIESEDEIINTILNIAKESSVKTNELVGDGTTTTIVLLESLFKSGLELIRKGISPIILKKELDYTLNNLLKDLDNISYIPNESDMLKIACVSSNDEKIGKIVYEVYTKVNNRNGIKIEESDNDTTNVKYYDGYMFDTNIASNYFFQNTDNITFNDSLLLIVDAYLDDIESISEILNEIIEKDKSLIIFANDYSEDFINNILVMYLENNVKVILLKNPLYGERQMIINKDLKVLSNASIINNINQISYKCLGCITSIDINKEKTIIKYAFNHEIKNYIKEIENDIVNIKDEFDRDYYYQRLAMFKNGLATIFVGALTNVECLEKKMRYEDALWAISNCQNGVVVGGGVTLLKLSSLLNESSYGHKLLKKALNEPFKQILSNAGINYEEVLNNIIKSNYEIIYNVKTEEYENRQDTQVIDSLAVVKSVLSNAVSIASMLLTTSSLVINEDKNLNKINKIEEL